MCRRVRLGALAPPCNRLQKADMFAVPISCCWLLPSIYDAIPSRRLHWFSCRVSWGPSQSWHRRVVWCAVLSWHNNYIRGGCLAPADSACFHSASWSLSGRSAVRIHRPSQTCDLPLLHVLQNCRNKPAVCWARFPRPPPTSRFVGQHAHVAAPRGIGIY